MSPNDGKQGFSRSVPSSFYYPTRAISSGLRYDLFGLSFYSALIKIKLDLHPNLSSNYQFLERVFDYLKQSITTRDEVNSLEHCSSTFGTSTTSQKIQFSLSFIDIYGTCLGFLLVIRTIIWEKRILLIPQFSISHSGESFKAG